MNEFLYQLPAEITAGPIFTSSRILVGIVDYWPLLLNIRSRQPITFQPSHFSID